MTTKPPSEADIIFNRANIALARSQRLVASWLPPRTTTTSTDSGAENKQDDDDEIFTAVPERFVSLHRLIPRMNEVEHNTNGGGGVDSVSAPPSPSKMRLIL